MARVSHSTWRAYSTNAWMGIVFGIPFLCVGLLILAIGLSFWTTARDAMNWSTAEAKVLAQRESISASGYTELTCEFQTSDGRTFTARGTLDRQHQKLSTITIYYDPNRPQRNLLSPERAKSIGHIATTLGAFSTTMGASALTFGIFTLRKHKRENRLFEQKQAQKSERRNSQSH
jgi:hypothetical protein